MLTLCRCLIAIMPAPDSVNLYGDQNLLGLLCIPVTIKKFLGLMAIFLDHEVKDYTSRKTLSVVCQLDLVLVTLASAHVSPFFLDYCLTVQALATWIMTMFVSLTAKNISIKDKRFTNHYVLRASNAIFTDCDSYHIHNNFFLLHLKVITLCHIKPITNGNQW